MKNHERTISAQWLVMAIALFSIGFAGCQQQEKGNPIFGTAYRQVVLTEDKPNCGCDDFDLTLLGFDNNGKAIILRRNAPVIPEDGSPWRREDKTYTLGIDESMSDPPAMSFTVGELDEQRHYVVLGVLYGIEIE